MTETPKRQFKGVWIPAAIWEHPNLSPLQKALLAEIDSLDDGKGCFASNEYLANLLHSTESTIANEVSKLRKRGWIKDISFNGRIRRIGVRLLPCIGANPDQARPVDTSPDEPQGSPDGEGRVHSTVNQRNKYRDKKDKEPISEVLKPSEDSKTSWPELAQFEETYGEVVTYMSRAKRERCVECYENLAGKVEQKKLVTEISYRYCMQVWRENDSRIFALFGKRVQDIDTHSITGWVSEKFQKVWEPPVHAFLEQPKFIDTVCKLSLIGILTTLTH